MCGIPQRKEVKQTARTRISWLCFMLNRYELELCRITYYLTYLLMLCHPSLMEVKMTSTVANWLSTPRKRTRQKKTVDQT